MALAEAAERLQKEKAEGREEYIYLYQTHMLQIQNQIDLIRSHDPPEVMMEMDLHDV